jgi:hypothetical protein
LVAATFRNILQMTLNQVYSDKGLRWEEIRSLSVGSQKRYSIRLSRSMRAIARREGNTLQLLAISADHDGAYGKR